MNPQREIEPPADRVTKGLRIRAAERVDAELIFSLIGELAEYERAADRVLGTPELLDEALFGADAGGGSGGRRARR